MTRMDPRRLVFGLVVALTAAVAAPALAQTAAPAQPKDDKKLQEAKLKSALVLVQVVDHAQAAKLPVGPATFTVAKPGQKDAPVAQPDAIKVSWHHDEMRASDNKVYMPFTATWEAGKLPPGQVQLILRAAPRGSAPLTSDERKKASYPWEDVSTAEPKPAGTGKVSVTRVLQVAAGAYDVYIAVRPFDPAQKKDQGPVTVALLKQELDVPDYTTSGLTTSSVLLVSKIQDLGGAAPTPDMQRERPYIMGPMELVPAVDGKFKKSDEFTFFFQVYNAQMENNKPDLTVEYAFYRKDGDAEKYFNKTNPQKYNAQTLPANWDASLGHLINGGQTIPLASFPEGEYRLEIKVTDNKAAKSITRNVTFSVASS